MKLNTDKQLEVHKIPSKPFFGRVPAFKIIGPISTFKIKQSFNIGTYTIKIKGLSISKIIKILEVINND